MEKIESYTDSLLGPTKLQTLVDLAHRVKELSLGGDIAEVGVYKGGSARLLCELFPSRAIHLFDTFSGIPFQGEGDVHRVGDFADTSLEVVQAALVSYPQAVFHAGVFPETTQGLEEMRFAFVHVDGAQYQTTLDALAFFYPRLVSGGLIVFDDYEWPHCPGVAQALFDFLGDKPEGVQQVGPHQVMLCKDQPGGGPRRLPYPEAARRFSIDSAGANYTKEHEVQVLLWLASQTAGGLVEIGANSGSTTRILAKTFPARVVYGVDSLLAAQMAPEQAPEVPSAADFCRLARHLPNVLPICSEGSRLNYEALGDVGFVFIDGDHSYQGVKADTERALRYLQARGTGILAWHDAYPNQPAWAGVWRYLSELSAAGMAIQVIDGTWVAYTVIEMS